MAKSDHLMQLCEMLHLHRWVALATVDAEGLPAASMVAYAPDAREGVLYLHLSTLAAHTRELLRLPQAALVLSECDTGQGDPQLLPRLSLYGHCMPIHREEGGHAAAQACYLRRLPDAAPRFGFSDFVLFRFTIEAGRFVGGFGQAHSYSGEELRRLLQSQLDG